MNYYNKNLPSSKLHKQTEIEKKEEDTERTKGQNKRRLKNIKRKANKVMNQPKITKDDVRQNILRSLFPERFSECA